MITNINSEDRLVQKTFADHRRDVHGWESIYAFNYEPFGLAATLGCDTNRAAFQIADEKGLFRVTK
jgi:type I restriction enzyme R subunit